jgi:fucose permease
MIFIADMGYMFATFFGGMAGQRYGLKKVMIFGFLVVIIGIAAMNLVNSFPLVVALLFLITAGTGCFDICANSLGAGLFVANAAIMMNLLHFFFGVGSSVSPKYAGWLLSSNIPWKDVYKYSLILVFIIFIFLIITRFPKKDGKQEYVKVPVKNYIKDKRVWLFVAVLGFAVICELGTANWLVNFLQKVHGLDVDSSSFYLSLFFIIFTCGRLIGGFLAERLGYVKLLLMFTAATGLFFILGLVLGSAWIILFSITGFFISTMYPTVVTAIVKEFKESSTAILGFVMTVSMGVGMIANWIIGKVSDSFGVWIGFASILIFVVLLVISLLGLNSSLKTKEMKIKIGRGNA